MSSCGSERMHKLLTQNRLGRRAVILIERWAAQGVPASRVPHERYWLLLDKLRAGRSSPRRRTDDLLGALRTFVADTDLVTILGWSVDDEPALLVSADKLVATLSSLNYIYPDGFVLISEAVGTALLVDFDDEEGTHLTLVDLTIAAC